MRMLMNNLDDEVGRASAATWWSTAARAAPRATGSATTPSCDSLQSLENDETLLVQSGKPVGIFRTHEYAPRVLICNSNLVGHWSNWEKFNELEKRRPDDVRPDDRRLVDLHRLAGNHPGNVRDFCRGGRKAFRRRPGRAS